jgi:ABC-2 type transport system ATP-binding protein
VSLAVALLGTPELLVLDEPTVGLDPVLRRDLWAVFHRLAGEGVTLLVSSHVMDEASRCDRLLLMRNGELLADDTPDRLLAATRVADVEAAFLALVEQNGDAADSASTVGRSARRKVAR